VSEAIPIACTLERAELPDRAESMAELGASLVSVEAGGPQAKLRFDGGAERLREFIRVESECCPFFDFDLDEEEPERPVLRIEAPAEGEWAVRGLVAGFVAGWGTLV
jgi:hypothetical protein